MPRPDPNEIINVRFELDGEPVDKTARSGRSALDFLRQDCQQTQLVPGCSPQGLCGCCAIMVNGKPKLSCTLRVKNLNGKSIQTLRGMDPNTVARLHKSFAAHGATQCGYCTPGIILQSAALLERNPEANASDIDKALNMHLCRCTGYSKIKMAIRSVQEEVQHSGTGFISPSSTLSSLGQSIRVADIRYPNTLYAVPVFSSTIGTLVAVDPSISEMSFASIKELFGHETHQIKHAGEPIGFTMSNSLDEARLLASEVHCTIDPEPVRLSFDKLSAPCQSFNLKKGSATVASWIKQSIEVPMQDPAYLEPDALICTPTENGYHLTVAGVNPHHLKSWLKEVGFPNVDVESLPCGASYGGRNINDLAHCALQLSKLKQQPIAIHLSFEQAQRMHPKSPPQLVNLELGLTQEGIPCALKGDIKILGGQSPDPKTAQQMAEAILTPYTLQEIDIEITVHHSTHPPIALLRDKGMLGFTLALESLMNRAADNAGFDPLSFRGKLLANPKFTPVLKAIANEVVHQQPTDFGLGLSMSRPSDSASVQIKLTVKAGSGIEIKVPIPESGQNLEAQLMSQAAIATGFPYEIFQVRCDTEDQLIGDCHDEDIPDLASIALAKACSAMRTALEKENLEDLDGQTWIGRANGNEADERFAAVLCIQPPEGRPTLFVVGGTTHPNSATESLIEGAAHMGLSVVLGEALRFDENGIPLKHLRTLNLLKAKNSPPIQSSLLMTSFGTGAGVSKMAAGAAVVGLANPNYDHISLPLSETSQAKSFGIRVR